MSSGDDLVLGLDVGVQSVGWALLKRKEGRFHGIERLGARVFDAGVEGDVASGRDEARGKDRRLKRLHRRLLRRRADRMKSLACLLQDAGLLPAGDLSTPEARVAFFNALDETLFPRQDRLVAPHVLPYRLRMAALDRKLHPHEFGRALYHLAHRRGYRPADRETATEEKERNQIETGISNLAKRIADKGARTLGEYLAGLDPLQERIRGRWTSRKMFEEEFERIWAAQAQFAPEQLTETRRKNIHRAIFFQRPSRWDRNTIGDCDLEHGEKRAPLCILQAQRFRLLQKVNDLRLAGIDPETGRTLGQTRSETLSADERERLLGWLERDGDIAFSKLRQKNYLNLPKWARFNHEATDDKRLIGNRTAARIRDALGDAWDRLADDERADLVADLRRINKPHIMTRTANDKWRLDSDRAATLARLKERLEDGYCNLSRKALTKLLPLMEKGMPFATARKHIYGAERGPKLFDRLPSVDRAPLPELRNPAVSRAMTELRKVVNHVIERYGKPVEIRVELARDLKRARRERQTIHKKNATQRDRRQVARNTLEQWLERTPSERDVEKYLLWEECDKTCPYTGRAINKEALFGPTPHFDIEHIIPFSRSLDDSYLNKTLCALEENRDPTRKANKTPWETYGHDTAAWETILQRVKRFKGDARDAKLERFQLQTLDAFEEFSHRQLVDARYASRMAMQYIGLLYGTGVDGVDEQGRRRLQAGRGGVTRYLRDEYGLNRILSDGDTKSRADHRHHAVDAVVIALTDAARVQELAQAAEQAWSRRRRRFAPLPEPWADFLGEVRRHIDGLVVSHRVSRKANAAMHDETFYARRKKRNGAERIHVRKLLGPKTNERLIASIVDPAVREAVRQHLAGHDNLPTRAFGDLAANPPRMPSGVPIRRVRIEVRDAVIQVGEGARARGVISASNHHMEILETGSGAKVRWEGIVVSTLDAMGRLRAGRPLVERERTDDKRFVFSLARGETLELASESDNNGRKELYTIRAISDGKVEFVRICDARKKADIQADKACWLTRSPNELRKMNCRKVIVTPLGEVRYAND